MDDVRKYLFSIIAAAIFSCIVISLMDKKAVFFPFVKLLTGVFISFTIISPLIKVHLGDISEYFSNIELDAQAVTNAGVDINENEMARIIKEQAEAYILDKATALGLDVQVSVTLSSQMPPVPYVVQLSGVAAPYNKKKLEKVIVEDLGIMEENLIWT